MAKFTPLEAERPPAYREGEYEIVSDSERGGDTSRELLTGFNIGEALGFAWAKVKKHFWFVVLWSLGTLIVSGLFSNGEVGKGAMDGGDLIFSLLNFVVGTFLTLGSTRLALKLLDDTRGDVKDFLPNWEMFWNVAIVSFLYGFIVLAGIVLLVFPAFIWGPRYSQAIFLVVDKKMGPIEALKESARITMGSKKKLVAYFFSSVGVILLGVLALVAGIIVALPLVMIASAYIYRKLSKEAIEVTSPVGI